MGVGALLIVLAGYFMISKPDGLDDSPVRDVIRAGNKKNVNKLMEFTKDSDINKATEALAQLARVQGVKARALMEQMLKDSRVDMRIAAAHQLEAIGDGKNCAPLIEALKDSDASVRMAVCRSLGSLHSGAGALAMLPMIEKEQPDVQMVALTSVNRAMGVNFNYDLNGPPGRRRQIMENMRKFATVLAGNSDQKPVDISKTN